MSNTNTFRSQEAMFLLLTMLVYFYFEPTSIYFVSCNEEDNLAGLPRTFVLDPSPLTMD